MEQRALYLMRGPQWPSISVNYPWRQVEFETGQQWTIYDYYCLWKRSKQTPFWHRYAVQPVQPPYVFDWRCRFVGATLLTISANGDLILLGSHSFWYSLHHTQYPLFEKASYWCLLTSWLTNDILLCLVNFVIRYRV